MIVVASVVSRLPVALRVGAGLLLLVHRVGAILRLVLRALGLVLRVAGGLVGGPRRERRGGERQREPVRFPHRCTLSAGIELHVPLSGGRSIRLPLFMSTRIDARPPGCPPSGRPLAPSGACSIIRAPPDGP